MDTDIPGTRSDQPRPRKTPQPAEQTFKLGRAAFLAGVAATGGALVLGKRAGSLTSFNFAPGSSSAGGFTIYTVTSGYPSFTPSTFQLSVGGMAANPFALTLEEILRHPAVTEKKFYQCVTGWTVPNTIWTGIRLRDLLDRAQPSPSARAVKFYSFDGVYTESLTMEQARKSDVLVAYKLDGKPLSRAQGAPIRLVVPGMYGYKFIKWLDRIELVPRAVDGYWEQNGYDRDAYIGRSNGHAV
ncbi:MAG: hypothetical protein NVS2B16_02230 [Chloroflexota bacterium]